MCMWKIELCEFECNFVPPPDRASLDNEVSSTYRRRRYKEGGGGGLEGHLFENDYSAAVHSSSRTKLPSSGTYGNEGWKGFLPCTIRIASLDPLTGTSSYVFAKPVTVCLPAERWIMMAVMRSGIFKQVEKCSTQVLLAFFTDDRQGKQRKKRPANCKIQ